MTRKRKNIRLVVAVSAALLLSAVAFFGMRYYKFLYQASDTGQEAEYELFIPTGADFDQVMDSLLKLNALADEEAFRWVAKVKKYNQNIKPGRYVWNASMSNDDLVNKLRSGNQDPVRVVVQQVRTLPDLAGLLADYLEPDSLEFIQALLAEEPATTWGVDQATMMTIFIPNTYEFFWNTSADKTLDRLHREYEKFWTNERTAKADNIGLSKEEVYTLASIVYAETKMSDEADKIAGVYMNRLKQGIPLQADPTLIFALGDFTIKRVLNKDREVDSPYNTYKYTGLTPGPINMPPIAWIDAVLNYEKHSYIFFCAKEDFSGYHNFAVTNAEHERNARRYQQALNQRKIYR
jgi:UPF0755 protein